jgi:hypothetical protein
MEAILRNPLIAKTKTFFVNLPTYYWFKDVLVVLVTIGVFAAIAAIYLALKPTVLIPPPGIVAVCPARWVYNTTNNLCEPQYPTKCVAFNPSQFSDKEKCDIVKNCGTYWKGLCDYS